MSFDIARIHWGSSLIFVCTRTSLPQTRPLDDPDWLVANARTIAETIVAGFDAIEARRRQQFVATPTAPYFAATWFGTDVSGKSLDNRIQWVRNNIVSRGLRVHRDDPSPTPGRMDPVRGTVGGQAFALSQRTTVEGYLHNDRPEWLATIAPQIANFVADNFSNQSIWFGIDVSQRDRARRVAFIDNAIMAGVLSVHIPDN